MQLLIARKGAVELMDAPDPVPAENEVLIETAYSAVSPGTELAALASQPSDVVGMVRKGFRSWEKVKKSLERRGWKDTLAKVEASVEKPIPLGYSLAGRVTRVGSAVEDFRPGDWVAASGPGAGHGHMAAVPRLFCARLPKPDMAKDACVAALACVGIHAMRRADLSAGAKVAVFGLGAIGQFTVQALRASGHRVLAFDPVESRRTDAARAGAEDIDPTSYDFEKASYATAHGGGLDAVFLCVKSDSDEVMRHAATLCRKRGRIVIVGEFPIHLPREAGYEKELEIRISAAYGEGRYDPAYERLDQDYPVEHGRGTVRRNMELFVRWLGEGRIVPSLMRPQVIPFGDAPSAYSTLNQSPTVLTLFKYSASAPSPTRMVEPQRSHADAGAVGIAVVGGGRFASESHLPNLLKARDKFHLRAVVGRTPARAAVVASRFNAAYATCDLHKAIADPETSALLIATPHARHAEQVIAALNAGKHVYVEKPLCISLAELARIEKAHHDARSPYGGRPALFVGFNRRHAPLSQKLAAWRARESKPVDVRYLFRCTPMPSGEWYDDPSQGGRFVGEVCHAVDWILWFTASPLESRAVIPGLHGEADVFLRFADSSRAHLRFQPAWKNEGAKERVEIQQQATRWVAEDFLELHAFQNDSHTTQDRWKSKGHREALDAFAAMITSRDATGDDPQGFLASSRLTLELAEALRT